MVSLLALAAGLTVGILVLRWDEFLLRQRLARLCSRDPEVREAAARALGGMVPSLRADLGRRLTRGLEEAAAAAPPAPWVAAWPEPEGGCMRVYEARAILSCDADRYVPLTGNPSRSWPSSRPSRPRWPAFTPEELCQRAKEAAGGAAAMRIVDGRLYALAHEPAQARVAATVGRLARGVEVFNLVFAPPYLDAKARAFLERLSAEEVAAPWLRRCARHALEVWAGQ